MKAAIEQWEDFPVYALEPRDDAPEVPDDLYQRYEQATEQWHAVQKEIRAQYNTGAQVAWRASKGRL
jgi:hypothetical protein